MPETIGAGSPTVVLPGARSTRPKTFRLVQVLRAIAALMVVGHHGTILLDQRMYQPGSLWAGGAAGVDLFFVISGLVMMLSAQRIERSARGAWIFLRRRLERIVPLYWIATTAKILFVLAVPALALNSIGSTWHVVTSYLFLPSLSPAHTIEPVLVVGWTLELEIVFYLLYAASLLLRLSPWLTVAPAFVLLACTRFGAIAPNSVLLLWSSPITFEFLWGMALGVCVLRGWLPPVWLSAGAVVVGAALLLMPWNFAESARPIVWGLPAAAVVAGALGLENSLGPVVPAFAQRLGDASYSIYLTHGFLLPLLGAALAESWRTQRYPAGLFLALAIVMSAALGLVCYQILELPMLRWFQLRRAPSRTSA